MAHLQHVATLVYSTIGPDNPDADLIHTQVSQWLKDHGESRHAAVYAVVGKDGTVNFVGVSRNVALSVGAHVVNEGEEIVHSLKVRSTSCNSQGLFKGSQYTRTSWFKHKTPKFRQPRKCRMH